jgi:hypothetical protein
MLDLRTKPTYKPKIVSLGVSVPVRPHTSESSDSTKKLLHEHFSEKFGSHFPDGHLQLVEMYPGAGESEAHFDGFVPFAQEADLKRFLDAFRAEHGVELARSNRMFSR